ncbi:MAG: EamA family transporter [Chloroflexi bacterium]|nr:EamA family transporter [Chloroflexota bacterium]MBP8060123.1 EamA family transporter [Chloroflexota bacterium]
MNRLTRPILQALFAAALFGASAPFAKLLLGQVEPVLLAGLLYLGSGLSAALLWLGQRAQAKGVTVEAGLVWKEWPWLAGAVLAGGVVAPIVLLFSLRGTAAATASLLLNFEGLATTLIAVLFFQEAISRKIVGAIGLIAAASIILSWDSQGEWGFSLGALGILLACILWGMDNNFTRRISAKNPLTIVTVKGLVAGSFSLVLGLILGNPLPGWPTLLGAMVLGSLSYGLSIMLFILSMRELGAARSSALFSTAPFIGALLSFLILRDPLDGRFVVGLLVMGLGASLLVGEDHGHAHHHSYLAHEHRHRHDDNHHRHDHPEPSVLLDHAHPHEHSAGQHEHPHTPDLHHHHGHDA